MEDLREVILDMLLGFPPNLGYCASILDIKEMISNSPDYHWIHWILEIFTLLNKSEDSCVRGYFFIMFARNPCCSMRVGKAFSVKMNAWTSAMACPNCTDDMPCLWHIWVSPEVSDLLLRLMVR